MEKQEWKNKIIEQTKNVRTFKPEFEDIIDTLATILEQRDKAFEQYISTGGHPVISHTNKANATNACKNPILVMWTELNTQALAFWRDLGLTPSGLKKIDERLLDTKKKKTSTADTMRDILKEIGK